MLFSPASSSPPSPLFPLSASAVMPPRTHRHATTTATQQQQQQQPSSSLTSSSTSSSSPSHAKRRLRHPPSKQLQQMREDGSLYDDFPSSSSPTHSGGPGVAAAVGSGSAPSRVLQRGEPGASPAAATHRNASSSSSSAQRPEREASSRHGSLTSDAGTAGSPSGGSSSAGAGPGVGCAVGDDGEDDGGEGKAGNTWGLTSPSPTAAAAAQPHTHHCRGISSSSRRRDSSDVRRASSCAVTDRGTTAAVTVPSPVSTSHTVSSGVPGGHVVYYGVPSTMSSFSSASTRRIPVTAGVFAAAHAPPGSEQTSPAVRAVDAPGRTSSSTRSSSISHNPKSNHRGGRCSGDKAVTAYVFPPLLDRHLSAETNADTGTPRRGDGEVEGRGSGADPDHHHPLSVPLVASSPQQYLRSGSDIPAMTVTEVDITATTTTTTTAAPDSTDTTGDTTPLTYAAVASGTASAGSTHGKRLPQSRVCFSQWRKRTGCSSISSGGAGSVLSTAGSVVAGTGDGATATPGTQAAAQAVLTATNLVTGSAEASQRALPLSGFPSAPLTVMIPSAATTNASRATGRSTPASTPPADGDDSDDSDVVNGLEDEEAADRGHRGGGGSERGRKAPPQQPHVPGHNAQDGLPLINSTAVAPAVTAAAAALTMPPLPPSVHRHQPTHLILQLPCARHGQQPRIGTDSDADADEEEVKAAGNGVGGGSGGSEPPRIGHDITSAATAHTATGIAATAGPTKMAAKADAPVSALHIFAPLTAQYISFSESSLSVAATPSAPMLATAATKPITPQSQSQQQRSSALISSRPPPTPQSAAGPPLASNTAFNASTPTPTRTPAQTSAVPTRGMPPRVASTASFFSAAEVLPGLFLGSYADSTDTEALAAHGISLVVNCSLECPVTPAMAHNPHHVRYVQCPLRDHSDEVIAPYFTPVTRIIHEQLHRRQINLQRLARRTTVAAAATTTGSGSCGSGSSAGPARATDVSSSVAADAGEGGEALAARLASWTWGDEAENVWAVPPSPASPSLSVGGQPSLKEGKRETPRTPSSAPGFGVRFGEAAMCSSTTTSCSPSPLPGRVATFPTTAAATAVLGACASGLDGSGSTAAAAAVLPPPPQQQVPALAPPAFSTTFATGAPPAVVAAPLSAPALAALAMAATPAPPPTPPVTVVDPRDCGGVLVHCRMGVSRSATFVMAYMILYGPTMAPLEDTASLFQHFLERERRIVEEAGGTACFTADSTTASTSITSIASPISATREAAHNSISGSGNAPSAFAGVLSSPPTPTPTNGPRVAGAGLAGSTFSACAHLQSPLQQQQPQAQLRSVSNSSLSMSSWARRRSPAIPVAASPVHLGAGNPCSSAVSATPTSPIEVASRVCRPCYLMRLREKRMQQHSQRQLLFSGQQQDQQQQQQRLQREEDEERDLVLAIAAANRAAATASATPCECGPDCAHVTRPIKSACVDHDSVAVADEAAVDEEYEGRRGVRLLQCRPLRTASPSSAPVLSRRSTRTRGSWSSRSDLDSGVPPQQQSTTTLLEAAYADERIAQQEQQQRCDDAPCDATGAEEAPAMPPRNSADAPAPTGLTVGAAAAAIHSAARQLRHTLAPRPSDGASDNAVEGRPVLRVSPLPSPPPLPTLCSSQATPLRSGAGPVRARACAGPVVTPTNTNTSIANVSGDSGVGGAGLLGVSFASSNASGVGVGASGAVATPISAAAAAPAVAPALTYREAFDAVKRQKPDVNPNIGFVLALRELAGGGDFSFSTSF